MTTNRNEKMLHINHISINNLNEAAKIILSEFNNQTIFVLQGEMGSGKTTFIKALCHCLGVEETVTSPTFALINEYKTNEGIKIYHFDFYRIKSPNEAFDFGYEEYFYSGNRCFIEWPEKIENLLPDAFVTIAITINEDQTRSFMVNCTNRLNND
jgi:tRNA threonylcarbamoyladenosine biosynthesis protein TsaE